MDLQEHREKTFETWEKMAPSWARERQTLWDVTGPVGEQLVAKLEPRPGQTILEIAAGIGDTGFAAAKQIGDTGKLISTDFSPQMVDAARRRAAELGLANVECRVMDAEDMDLDDDSVDGVLCRWGYMLMADPAAAFRQTRRVLRDGGRLCFSVWAGPERNPWAALAGTTLVGRGHMPAPEPGEPGMFGLADPHRIRELVTGAGFEHPEIEEFKVEWRFEEFGDYWRFLSELAGGMALTISALPEDERRAIREEIEGNAGSFAANGGYAMPGATLNVLTS